MLHPSERFACLEMALHKVAVPLPGALGGRIAALPQAGTLPDPGTAWLFVNSMLYRGRQQWARKQLQQHLPSFFVDKDAPIPLKEGIPIPGMLDWQLDIVFDHWGAITHRSTREYISGLSRHRHVGEQLIFPHDIPGMVPSNSTWDIPGRLTAAARGHELRVAVDALVAARILLEIDFYGLAWEGIGDPNAHRLSQRVCGMSRGVHEFHRLWENPDNRLWLAAVIGDWPTANELAALHEDPKVRIAVAEKFAAYRQRRLAIARFHLSLQPDSIEDLEVLYREEGEDFDAGVKRSIAAKPANPLLAELLLETGDPQWNPQLFAALERLSVEQVGWDQREIFRLARALLERDYRADDVLDVLANYGCDLHLTAMLFLKHTPPRALAVIREALRYEPPGAAEDAAEGEPRGESPCRVQMAAALAIIDEPWSRQEILDAINDIWTRHHDSSTLVALALALSESRDPAVRAIGDSWQAKCAGSEKWAHQEWTFRNALVALHEEAIQLRGVSLPAAPASQPGDAPQPQAGTPAAPPDSRR